ncbi:ABC transporter substrate-binding protein [Psychromicrobium lacuslunae]|uniref:ABC transporter substrate-binding protein n=2 Tax=Psychromicrobium lacuslunae TaxID=1618207 RepID=A0A0D4C3I0_9MICC|nr:ABC transporter substrate-binding protein [Psychromicrobium lacuslunae]
MSACTNEPAPPPTTTSTMQLKTFSFGTAADPAGLDPALVSDVDSNRVSRQIFEGLVTADPTTGEPAPALATSWNSINNGLGYEFTLREKVKFQDGQPFNAAAVCMNFNRWFNYPVQKNPAAIPSAFKDLFRTFANDAKNSVYKSCTVDSEYKLTVSLNLVRTGFLDALTQAAFGIASPAALKSGTADVLDQRRDSYQLSKFALHPVGTGPYQLTSWQDGVVTLQQNPDYWGDKGQINTIKFITYQQSQARSQALLTGKIDGYDFVTPDNFDALVKRGLQVQQRDPFSVFYLGLNQQIPALADIKVRQAISIAIDKDALVKKFFIDGSTSTNQFIPPKLSGFNNQVPGAGYDREKARKLIKESSYRGAPLKFYYPLNVTRPYLPTPEKIYAEIAAELTAIGLNIKPVPVDWSDNYLEKVSSSGDHALHLLGLNGSYSDPDNFVGPLFGAPNAEFGPADSQLISKIERAKTLPDGAERSQAYQSINADIASTIPAIPIAFPISALALSSRVSSYPVSPVLNEVFNKITLNS